MSLSLNQGFYAAWAVFSAFWLAAVGFSKPQQRTVSSLSRLTQSAIMILGFLLIFHPWFRQGWLGIRLWPTTVPLAVAGLIVTWLGVLFAIWARVTLGANWSARPMVKVDHQLIVKGPYRLARHPIYTGLFTAAVGSSLAIARVAVLPGLVLILAGVSIKIVQEEKLMNETFPAAYPDYRRRVKALIPWVV